MLRNRSGFQRKPGAAVLGADSFFVVRRQASPPRLTRLFCRKSPALIHVMVIHQLACLGVQLGHLGFQRAEPLGLRSRYLAKVSFH